MSELRAVLEKHGFRFKKQFGQNFISDNNLLRSICLKSNAGVFVVVFSFFKLIIFSLLIRPELERKKSI